ncbi:integrase/recombinase XerD [Mycoplasmoides fastidiosum]|uniref:Integrase/recombinase XerD n=1 Tax=Mycoplasmoides fastidiosum TaxID=92758 RepID=A0ABU0LZZ4_9BACT|nr:site-specific integrase [Mycoplasmoides fastidiosum]MDQ0514276.1 integrase/recombinase XerD [Mycoplasmoides fastidiosum]UUD38120.1 site-specific integrase [Mycoplasmoides fastidiosum]
MKFFLDYLRKKNLSKNTIITYKNSLLFLDVENWDWIKIKKKIFHSNYAANTVHLHKNVLLQYLKFKNNKQYIKKLEMIKLPPIDTKYYLTISKNMLYKKTQILDHDSDNDRKWKIIIRFIFETGIRASELHTLQLKNEKLYTLGKGNKLRQLFYVKETLILMLKYFPDLKGFYHNKSLRLAVKKYLDKKYTPHSIRRSFATHMLNNGSNPKSLMLQMGHSKVETTYRYLNLSEKYNEQNYNRIMKKMS